MESRNYRLDLLKGISIILVVIWHFQPLRLKEQFHPSLLTKAVSFSLYIFNNQIIAVAVPVFFLISLYLFFQKQGTLDSKAALSYLRKRLTRIFSVYGFYLLLQFALYYLTQQFQTLDKPHSFSIAELTEFILVGGSPLPIVSYSVLYFLLDLGALVFLSFIYFKLAPKLKKDYSLLLIVFFLAYLEISPFFGNHIPPHRLDNFLVYIPIAFIWWKNPSNLIRFKNWYAVGFLLFSVHDHLLRPINLSGQLYSRVSILLGALTLITFCCSLKLNSEKIKPIEFLSKHSLGIYALHKYVMLLISACLFKAFSLFGVKDFINIMNLEISSFSLLTSLFTCATTLLFVYGLGLTPLKRFVI